VRRFVRRLALIPLFLLAIVLASCGGGSGSSSGSSSEAGSTTAGNSPEAAWTKELKGVMTAFENNVSARSVEEINTTYVQHLLEPLYRNYAVELDKLTDQLEATEAPGSCAPVQQQIVTDGRALAQLTKQLSRQSDKNEEEYAAFAQVQRTKITRYGQELTKLTFEPSC
jgi:hypothetical protein